MDKLSQLCIVFLLCWGLTTSAIVDLPSGVHDEVPLLPGEAPDRLALHFQPVQALGELRAGHQLLDAGPDLDGPAGDPPRAVAPGRLGLLQQPLQRNHLRHGRGYPPHVLGQSQHLRLVLDGGAGAGTGSARAVVPSLALSGLTPGVRDCCSPAARCGAGGDCQASSRDPGRRRGGKSGGTAEHHWDDVWRSSASALRSINMDRSARGRSDVDAVRSVTAGQR